MDLHCIGIKTFVQQATGEERFEPHNRDIQQPLEKHQQKIACSLSDIKDKMRKTKDQFEATR